MKKFFCYVVFLCLLLTSAGIKTAQAQDNSYYRLDVKNVAPKNIRFINNSKLKVKVIVYKGRDNTMAVGLKSFTISPGKSASYKVGVYNVKIFKPGLVDKHLLTKKNVSGNLRISGSEKHFSAVRLSTRKNTEFRNNTGKKIKICLYKRSDIAKTIPFETYVLTDNTSTASYSGDQSSFFVSVFEPGLLDKLLVSQICPYRSIITVKKIN